MRPISSPFNRFLGTELLRADEAGAEVALQLEPHHLNKRGVAHGGVVLALLDSAMGAAVIASMPAEWWCATTSLSTQFVRGPRGGRLVAAGHVVRRGRRVAFVAGELRDAGGTVLATAHGTWHLWEQRPGQGGGPEEDSSASGSAARDATGDSANAALARPGKIVAVGRNYAAHAAEMGVEAGEPIFFLKPPTALASDGDVILLPEGAGEVHHEVELVAVIGTGGRHIPAARALEHVAGWAVGVDLTLRDLQRAAKQRGEPWSVAKGFDGAAPVSAPVPRDRAGDGSGLAIELSVNGEVRQRGTTSAMLYDVPALIAEISRWMTLEPGDLVFTGTPQGVGPVRPGDRLEASIERVGGLAVTFAAGETP